MSLRLLIGLLWLVVEVHSQTFPYVSFMGQTLAPHSYVDLSLVGEDVSGSDSVQCHTDLTTCCSAVQGVHRGDWYFPDGARLPFSGGAGDIIHERRENQRVDLRRGNSATTLVGIYRCDIATIALHDDNNISVRDVPIYVGLYTASGGDISVTNVSFDGVAFTCESVGGPAMNVTWTRDSVPLTGSQETVLEDPVTALYTHTLLLTAVIPGTYTCTVANGKPSAASASISIDTGVGQNGEKGAIGEKGQKGETGEVGMKGEPGEPGESGVQGPHGDDGEAGLPGPQGAIGPQGPKGDQGDRGDSGEPGEPGAKGEQGPKGDKGDVGEPGERGADGREGVPGEQGERGTKGDMGDKGRAGFGGPQGSVGPKGDKGDKGRAGFGGPQGSVGPKGDKGDCEKGEKGDGGGATYVRWGKQTCPDTEGTEMVYNGTAASSHHYEGGGGNYQCLTDQPANFDRGGEGREDAGYIYGTEFEAWGNVPPSSLPLTDQNVACAVCYVATRGAVVMIPGTYICPPGWTREYYGYLMSERHKNRRSTFECVDESPDILPKRDQDIDREGDDNGALFYHVEPRCGSLPCPPYEEQREVTCVVCSR